MAKKPTYEELEQKVNELEEEAKAGSKKKKAKRRARSASKAATLIAPPEKTLNIPNKPF